MKYIPQFNTLKQILQLKYLRSNTRWRIVQYPIARWQRLLPGLCRVKRLGTNRHCRPLSA